METLTGLHLLVSILYLIAYSKEIHSGSSLEKGGVNGAADSHIAFGQLGTRTSSGGYRLCQGSQPGKSSMSPLLCQALLCSEQPARLWVDAGGLFHAFQISKCDYTTFKYIYFFLNFHKYVKELLAYFYLSNWSRTDPLRIVSGSNLGKKDEEVNSLYFSQADVSPASLSLVRLIDLHSHCIISTAVKAIGFGIKMWLHHLFNV